jgi:hypothetical protein
LQRAAQSSYTRTKFDSPTATPSLRNSAIFTVNSSLNNSGQHIKLNIETPEMINKSGLKTFKISNNSLHPNDALKIKRVKSSSKVSLDTNETSSINTNRKGPQLVDGLKCKKAFRSSGELNLDKAENKKKSKLIDANTDVNNDSDILSVRCNTRSVSLGNIPTHKETFYNDLVDTVVDLTIENKSEKSGTEPQQDSTV